MLMDTTDPDVDYITVLEPITLTDAMLVSSTVTEPDTGDPAIWDPAYAYSIGDYATRMTTHSIYRALLSGADTSLPEDTPGRWFRVDSTNRWAMLDNKPGAATLAASPMTYVLRPGRVSALWMGGLIAEQAVVTVKDMPGGTVVYSSTSSLEASAPPDYWEYFFSPFNPQTDLLLDDLPPYATMEITITLTAAATVACSALLIGSITALAETMAEATAKPRSFVTITLDENGNNTTKPGAATKDLTLNGQIYDISDADETVDIITRLLTTNCLWSGSANPNYSALRQFGIGSAQVDYSDQVCVALSLSVQGILQ